MKKLSEDAQKVYDDLSSHFDVEMDVAGTIGKRYRRYDAIGTPWCVTFDYDSLEDNTVTLRDRDTMQQKRIPISELKEYFQAELEK